MTNTFKADKSLASIDTLTSYAQDVKQAIQYLLSERQRLETELRDVVSILNKFQAVKEALDKVGPENETN